MSKAHRQRTFIGTDIPRSHYSEKRMSGSFPDRNYSGRLTSHGLRQFARILCWVQARTQHRMGDTVYCQIHVSIGISWQPSGKTALRG
jgi:hypothetical protein